jgi:predicted transcriptional regulator
MIIDFDERKFKNEVKNIARKYGATTSDSEKVASIALSAVYKASKPVNQ